jgi:predicted ATP-grasp superfamily ATP-dependent carboligase
MQVFIYEYTCALPDRADVSASIRAEGRAMLTAIRADFDLVPGVRTLVVPPGDREADFRATVRAADYSLIIAPEFDGLLETRCRWVEEEGGRLLGPSSAAVRLTGDKLALGRLLEERGVPTPACHLWPGDEPDLPFPLVCKPRYGAGSLATRLVRDIAELCEVTPRDMIVQPFVPGTPASVAFLIGPTHLLPLRPAQQLLSDDGRFRYLGGRVPLPDNLAGRAVTLAERAVTAVPRLAGYVGVDLVLGDADDGSQDTVIEINPRLTTSYIGLRALALTNLADAMLQVACGKVPNLEWREGCLDFCPDAFTP